ncbi:MAG: type II toxin-antitoxin system RelE/ParE family toxin [Candidatus Sulfotelmatobacter sp.]
MEIRRYLTASGRDVFGEWLRALKDVRARARIVARIDRLSVGNFGDCKPLRGGLFELRIDCGPGYRVYYAIIGGACMLLLCGGDKGRQSSDIERALEYLKDYRERTR